MTYLDAMKDAAVRLGFQPAEIKEVFDGLVAEGMLPNSIHDNIPPGQEEKAIEGSMHTLTKNILLSKEEIDSKVKLYSKLADEQRRKN